MTCCLCLFCCGLEFWMCSKGKLFDTFNNMYCCNCLPVSRWYNRQGKVVMSNQCRCHREPHGLDIRDQELRCPFIFKSRRSPAITLDHFGLRLCTPFYILSIYFVGTSPTHLSPAERLTLPGSIRSLGYGAFGDCTELFSLEYAWSKQKAWRYPYAADNAFEGCLKLTTPKWLHRIPPKDSDWIAPCC